MMENRYRQLSPRGSMQPCLGPPSGHFINPTLSHNYSVLRTSLSEKSRHLPLADNCENSLGNAGMARAVLLMFGHQKGCQMA